MRRDSADPDVNVEFRFNRSSADEENEEEEASGRKTKTLSGLVSILKLKEKMFRK